MRHRIQQSLLPILAAITAATAAPAGIESLTLEQAFELAERRHPRLAEARAQVEAAAGRAEDAGKLPNPEAIVRAEQLPLRDYATPDRQYVAGFGQTIPLGRRLSRARDAELLEREVSRRGLESVQRQLRQRVHGAFATALYQESAFQARSRIADGWTATRAATRARLEAGDAIREDLARAELELARADAELTRCRSLREQALVSLAAALGDSSLEVKSVDGNLEADFDVPTLESLAASLATHPASQEAEAAVQAARARIDLAQAERIPDVQVEVLYRRLEAGRQDTVDFGLRLPLPLFNRSQGRIREAEAAAAGAEARARMTAHDLGQGLREAHLALTTALDHLKAYRTRILPHAETVLKSAELRHAAGDIALTEVLPVRRDWATVHLGYLETLRDVLQAWTEVAGYLGQAARR